MGADVRSPLRHSQRSSVCVTDGIDHPIGDQEGSAIGAKAAPKIMTSIDSITYAYANDMPNLPPDFDPKEWEIVTTNGSVLYSPEKNLQVIHRPTGVRSRVIRFNEESIGNSRRVESVLRPQVNRLIMEVYSQLALPYPEASNLYAQEFGGYESRNRDARTGRFVVATPAKTKPLLIENYTSKPQIGEIFFDQATGSLYIFNGDEWLRDNPPVPDPKPAKPNSKPPINNTAATHNKRKFNLD
jgi:hypothetical protein